MAWVAGLGWLVGWAGSAAWAGLDWVAWLSWLAGGWTGGKLVIAYVSSLAFWM